MTIFVSDTHFGRSPGAEDEASERDLLACIHAAGAELDTLFLVGDVFEHYVEYKHVIPKGFARFQGMLADLTDRGIPVKYVVGNHDPWHRDYFESELGVDVIFDRSNERIHDFSVLITHGDGLGPRAGPYRFLKPILRHPVPVSLYKTLLPSDLGVALAKWYSRNFRSEAVNEKRVVSLRQAALELLERNPYDLVVMGHSHVAELLQMQGGTYVNCGCWYSDRSIAVLEPDGPSLKKWQGQRLVDFIS